MSPSSWKSSQIGKCCFAEKRPGSLDFENELFGFPNNRYDDQVDALFQALIHARPTYLWDDAALKGFERFTNRLVRADFERLLRIRCKFRYSFPALVQEIPCSKENRELRHNWLNGLKDLDAAISMFAQDSANSLFPPGYASAPPTTSFWRRPGRARDLVGARFARGATAI